MSALPINRGEGSRRKPIGFLSCGLIRDRFRRLLVRISQKYGDCWVNYLDGSNGQIKIELNAMFEEDLIIPIPRVAKQPSHYMRYQATGKAIEIYGESE